MTKLYKLYENPAFELPERSRCCFFTGHRTFAVTEQSTVMLRSAIEYAVGRGYDTFFAGGAIGFDTCAEAMTANLRYLYPHIELNLVLPFFGYSHKMTEHDRAIFSSILSRCDSVFYMLPAYSNESYHMRNRFMADHSSLCIAYLHKEGSGTSSAVKYAMRLGCEVVNIGIEDAQQQRMF